MYILGEYNLGVHLGLTEHIKHLQCRSTEEIWNVYRISFLPIFAHQGFCVYEALAHLGMITCILTARRPVYNESFHCCID